MIDFHSAARTLRILGKLTRPPTWLKVSFWLALLLVGCSSPTRWTRQDLTAADFQRDNYACVRDAEQTAPRLPYGDGLYQLGAARRREQLYQMCMTSLGYRKE